MIKMGLIEIIIDKLIGGVYKKVEGFTKPRLKKVSYWLKNQPFIINLKLIKVYPGKPIENLRSIDKKLRKLHTVKEIYIGQNHIEVLYEDFQVPIRVELSPEIPLDILANEDIEEVEKEFEIRTEIKIRLIGYITCRYREEDHIRSYLNRIEKISKLVDDIFERRNVYENITVDIKKYSIRENWVNVKTDYDSNLDLKINIGDHSVQLNGPKFTNMLEGIKKYALEIPDSSL